MTSTAATATAATFAAVLVLAAAAKLHSPASAARAIARVVPRRWLRAHPHVVAQSGRLVAAGEIAAAPVIVLVPILGSAVAAALAATFVVVVTIVRRRGASCGCWGSLVPGQAGGAELARALGMATIAVSGLILDLRGAQRSWSAATVGLADHPERARPPQVATPAVR